MCAVRMLYARDAIKINKIEHGLLAKSCQYFRYLRECRISHVRIDGSGQFINIQTCIYCIYICRQVIVT